MEKSIKITAVCGWAIAPAWFRERVAHSFPSAEIHTIYPRHPEDPNEAKALLGNSPSDIYIGYSLGSLWLLYHRKNLPSGTTKALLAPILAFTREQGHGGKTSSTQLKYLIKLLKTNPSDTSALKDFYTRCNFSLPESWMDAIPDNETLIKGLEFLGHIQVSGTSARDFLAIVGENDSFLDATILKRNLPQLEIIIGAGHEPDLLLDHLAKNLIRTF